MALMISCVKGRIGLKRVEYRGIEVIINWNKIKSVDVKKVEFNFYKLLECLNKGESLKEVVNFFKIGNTLKLIFAFASLLMDEYFDEIIKKQIKEMNTSSIDLITQEVFGLSKLGIRENNNKPAIELEKIMERLLCANASENVDSKHIYVCLSNKVSEYYISNQGTVVPIILINFPHKDVANNIKFLVMTIPAIEKKILNFESLTEQTQVLGRTNIFNILFGFFKHETFKYFEYCASLFTEQRRRITLVKLIKETIDPSVKGSWQSFKGIEEDIKARLENLVNNEYDKQLKILPLTNNSHMERSNLIWKYYWRENHILSSVYFDFSFIKYKKIREGFMAFMKNSLLINNVPNARHKFFTVATGIRGLELVKTNFTDFSEIQKSDVRLLKIHLETSYKTKSGKNASISFISKIFTHMSQLIDFIKAYNTEQNEFNPIKVLNVPQHNYFDDFKFTNLNNMKNNTKFIPEVVMEALNKYKYEMSDTYRLIFDIFNSTGLRAKEVSLLEYDALKYDTKNEMWYMLVKNYKTEKSKVKKGLEEKRIVPIPNQLAQRINKYQEETQKFRDEVKSIYLFIKKAKGFGHNYGIVNPSDVMKAMKTLIKNKNIMDDNGDLWNITTRQSRKTFAVNLVSNGASMEEVSTALDHAWLETTALFYTEVDKMRVADMNSEFFQKKFEVQLTDEQWSKFSEKERKQLYIDFCLGTRTVELGQCSLHISEGVCNKIECATCSNLCTGRDYIDKWEEMFRDQSNQLNSLKTFYEKNHITDYSEYVEYKRMKYLSEVYREVIKNISL